MNSVLSFNVPPNDEESHQTRSRSEFLWKRIQSKKLLNKPLLLFMYINPREPTPSASLEK